MANTAQDFKASRAYKQEAASNKSKDYANWNKSGLLKNWHESLAKDMGGEMWDPTYSRVKDALGQDTMAKVGGLVAQGLGQSKYGEHNPMEGQRYLDEGSQGLLDTQTERVLGGQPDFFQGLNPKLSETRAPGLATEGAQGALEKRAEKDFERGLGRLKRDAAFQRPEEESAALGRTGKLLSANEQLRIANYKEQANFVIEQRRHNEALAAAKSAAKKGLLGTILGGIGTVIGGLVGGPAGAAAGATLGGGAAQATG